jgi:hypothetical protein
MMPKGNRRTRPHCAFSHLKKLWCQGHNVTPPEGADIFPFMGRSTIPVEMCPSDINPRQINFVIEFMQKFHQQGSIVSS